MKRACSAIFIQNANRCSFVLQLLMLIFKLNAVLQQTFVKSALFIKYLRWHVQDEWLQNSNHLNSFELLVCCIIIFFYYLHYENHMSI